MVTRAVAARLVLVVRATSERAGLRMIFGDRDGAGLPLLGVAAHARVRGLDSLDGPFPADLEFVAFRDAFEREWTSDAHFITYQVAGVAIPRLRKCSLAAVRERVGEPVVGAIFHDWDTPSHAPWTDESIGAFADLLDKLADHWLLSTWAVLYLTRAGARFAYVLDRFVTPEEAEAIHVGMVRESVAIGLGFDHELDESGVPQDRCRDWTRLFRLPRVLRDGTRTSEARYFAIDYRLDRRLNADDVPREEVETRAEGDPLEWDAPDPDEARKLLLSGAGKPTQWARKARERLKGLECYAVCFEDRLLQPREGKRHEALKVLIGQAIGFLASVPNTTPERVYALFLEPVLQLAPRAAGHDWTRELYRLVDWCWEQQRRERATQEQEVAEREADVADLSHRVVAGAREWCDDAALEAEHPQAMDWLSCHLIVAQSRGYHVMTETGWYDSLAVSRDNLPARIRELGMDRLIEIERPTDQGVVGVEPRAIVRKHATFVSDMGGQVQIPGAFVRDVGRENARLVFRMFARKEVEPAWSEDVDQWLQLLFGDHYEKACAWIGHALAFDEGPICALSIAGPPNIGKKMVAIGLAECLDTEKVASPSDLIDRFAPNLLKTCFLVVNEGFPTLGRANSPADSFRRVVSGEVPPVDQKYMPLVHVLNPVRVILTANNLDVVRTLAGRRDLSPEDREALMQRLFHVDATKEVADWLRARGGRAFTRGWIRGDGGEPSRYVVARHFLELYRRRPAVPAGQRFLVEGDPDSPILFELRTESGSAPLVIETIIKMLGEVQAAKRRFKGFVVEGDDVYVLTSEILDYYRQNLAASTREVLNAKKLADVIVGLSTGQQLRMVLPCRKEVGRQRWWKLDAKVLHAVAQRYNWPSAILDRIVEGAPVIDARPKLPRPLEGDERA